MQLGNHISIKQTQNLALTPEIKQSIKVLQYNQIELKNYIDEALLSNPLLQSNETLMPISDGRAMKSLIADHRTSYSDSKTSTGDERRI